MKPWFALDQGSILSKVKRIFKKLAPNSPKTQGPISNSNPNVVNQAEAAEPEVDFLWTSGIPREIIFQIIDIELLSSISTLQSLSLTCRILHIYTRQHLFRQAVIHFGVTGRSSISRFLATIGHSPSVLSCIQNLEFLIHVYPHTLPKRQLEDMEFLSFVAQQSFPKLQSFRLKLNTYIQQSPESSFKLNRSLFYFIGKHKITRLTLRGREALDINLLHYATHVRDLNFQDLAGRNAEGSNVGTSIVEIPPASVMRPSTISLYAPQSRKSLPLSSQPNYCDLSAVTTFRFYGDDTPFFVPPYLNTISSTLTKLDLYRSSSRSIGVAAPIPALDLSTLYRLQHLVIAIQVEFDLDFIPSGLEYTTQFDWVINSLYTLPTPCLVSLVKLLIGSDALRSCNTLDWERFDNVVFGTTGKWGRLKNLEMIFFVGHDGNQEMELGSLDTNLPQKLKNFRGLAGATLDANFEVGMSIWQYLPEGMR